MRPQKIPTVSSMIVLSIYAGTTVLYLISILWIPTVTMFLKPLMMPLLMIFYLLGTPVRDRFLLRALFFCWVGDILLMGWSGGPNDFLLGLMAFMAGHILYILCFRRLVWLNAPRGTSFRTTMATLLVCGMGGYVFWLIYPGANDLLFPVLAYLVVIVSMFYHTVRRIARTSAASYWTLLAGATLFMISDSILGLNRFYKPISGEWILVMSTYLGAQFLIVRGVMIHPSEPTTSYVAHG